MPPQPRKTCQGTKPQKGQERTQIRICMRPGRFQKFCFGAQFQTLHGTSGLSEICLELHLFAVYSHTVHRHTFHINVSSTNSPRWHSTEEAGGVDGGDGGRSVIRRGSGCRSRGLGRGKRGYWRWLGTLHR